MLLRLDNDIIARVDANVLHRLATDTQGVATCLSQVNGQGEAFLVIEGVVISDIAIGGTGGDLTNEGDELTGGLEEFGQVEHDHATIDGVTSPLPLTKGGFNRGFNPC